MYIYIYVWYLYNWLSNIIYLFIYLYILWYTIEVGNAQNQVCKTCTLWIRLEILELQWPKRTECLIRLGLLALQLCHIPKWFLCKPNANHGEANAAVICWSTYGIPPMMYKKLWKWRPSTNMGTESIFWPCFDLQRIPKQWVLLSWHAMALSNPSTFVHTTSRCLFLPPWNDMVSLQVVKTLECLQYVYIYIHVCNICNVM